jgi:hypothetical protein
VFQRSPNHGLDPFAIPVQALQRRTPSRERRRPIGPFTLAPAGLLVLGPGPIKGLGGVLEPLTGRSDRVGEIVQLAREEIALRLEVRERVRRLGEL